ncbi:MAG: ATP-binding cassette domain-containing protein [Caldithrix sp.]|nr:ATP-binding cassette domain-containing protein [Caldithrix sp.]
MYLHCDAVTKYFDEKLIFKNVSFEASTGNSIAIIGPNGSGKTTLLRILCNLMQPTEGIVKYKHNGNVLLKQQAYRYFSLIGPYLELYEQLTARENLTFFAKMQDIPNYPNLLTRLMQRMNLSGREDDPVKTYSSGMKQRLKYVFALLSEPKILFVDEPRANLDEEGIDTVYSILTEQRKKGILIIATNDSEDLKFADYKVTVHA